MKKIEVRVFEGNKGLEDIIKFYGMKKIKVNIFEEIINNEVFKNIFIENRKKIIKLFRLFDERKKEVNKIYLINFYDIY